MPGSDPSNSPPPPARPLPPPPLPRDGGVAEVFPGVPGVDAAGVVHEEIPCRKCGYTLRALSVHGRCPECGTPIGLSVHGDLLRYSEPRWVRTLQRGVKLIIAGIAIILLSVIAGAVIGATGRMSMVIGAQGVSIVGTLLMLVGGWLLTEPDPSGIGEDRYGTSRKIIRVALIVALGSTAVDFVNETAPLAPDLRRALMVISGVAGLVSLIGQFAQLRYLSKLAARIPDPALEQRARFLMWGISITYGLLLLIGLGLALGGMNPGAAPMGGAMVGAACMMGVLALALLVFGVMYLFMLDKLRVQLGRQARAAEASWALTTALND